MKAEPIYAKSAPSIRAARMARPLAIAPDSAIGPSNHCRVSATNANGDISGMAARAGRYQDQTVRALLDRLVREFLIDHIVKNDATPTMRGLIEFFARAERGDDHRHLVLLAKRKILIEPVVRPVYDLVNRERRRQPVGMRLVVRGKLLLDPYQPLVEQRRGTRVQRRKRSDDTRFALSDHQIGHGNNEQRRTDHG